MLSPKIRLRIDWVFDIIRTLDRIPKTYFKHIEATNLYEVRILA